MKLIIKAPSSCSAPLLFILLLISTSRLAYSSVHDDNQAWNSFFRNMRSTPQFPYPGTLNNMEWDLYVTGFPPSLWDTKDFLSILVLQPELINQAYGNHPILWENFWSYFEVFLKGAVERSQMGAAFNWNHVRIQKIWYAYIEMVRELYCCPYMATINGSYAFGCRDFTQVNMCCDKQQLFGLCTDVGQKIIKEWSSHSLQALRFKFYLWLCVVYANERFIDLNAGTEAIRELKAACPNPCSSYPCDDLPNAVQGSCRQSQMPLAPYRDEFTCQCRPNFFFDTFTKQCQPQSQCSLNPCNANGTKKCSNLPMGFTCECRPEYSGTVCSSLVNPCQRRRRSVDIPGNIACRTSLGNKCVPREGLDIFACECVPPYRRETNFFRLAAAFRKTSNVTENELLTEEILPPDNCMAKLDACERVVCSTASEKNRCMPAGDLLAFICVCEKNEDGYPLYEGEFCETPVSQWASWSNWGVCRPECGESCFQARQRICSHMDGNVYCRGSDEELRACEPACRPCPNRSFTHLSGVFVKETAAPLLLAAVSLFLVQLLVLAVIEWVFSPDVTPPL